MVVAGRVGLFQMNVFDQFAAFGTQRRGRRKLTTAALLQQDERLQFPFICNISKETWKTKEAKVNPEDATGWGDLGKRGILIEAMSAVTVLMAGGDLLIMRHPEAIKLTREIIDDLSATSN